MSACERKVVYLTAVEGRRRARVLNNVNQMERKGQLRPYHCPDCDGWHLTSMPKALVRQVRVNRRKALEVQS